jgi:hypothetical protein
MKSEETETLSREEQQELEQHGRTKDDVDTVPVAADDELQDPALDEVAAVADDGDTSTLPEWAQNAIPPNLKIPKGETVFVVRFLKEWTKDRSCDRTAVIWQLSVGDEKLANQRGGDNSANVLMELSKQMIRAIDGKKVDYTGRSKEANLDAWWNAIGRKCRSLISAMFIRMHALSDEEKSYFLARCYVARTLCVDG